MIVFFDLFTEPSDKPVKQTEALDNMNKDLQKAKEKAKNIN